ncbi:MAG: hypothetical protein QNL88_04075 [Acidobacteriota bacterium]|nr:hypothetical protein [Acidobacteriota bacterium]
MATKQETLWFGYLEAGEKSGPVVRDVTLGTGTETTFYLFSLNRGAILEYRRDIAEPKLRELTEEEMDTVDDLRQAFEQARKKFTPREARKPKPVPAPKKKARVEKVEEVKDEGDAKTDATDAVDAKPDVKAKDAPKKVSKKTKKVAKKK